MVPIFPKDKLVGSKTGYTVIASMDKPQTFQVDGDLDTSEIIFTLSGAVSDELTDAYDSKGEILKITKTKPTVVFYANAKIQIDKPAGTTNNVGLNLV